MRKSHETLRATRDSVKKHLQEVTLLFFTALLLSACGGGGNDEETNASGAAQQESSGTDVKILATTSQAEGVSFCYTISNTTKTNYTYYRFYAKENGAAARGTNVNISGKTYLPGSAGRVEVALDRNSSGAAVLYRNRTFSSLKKIDYREEPTANYCPGTFTDGSLSKAEAQQKYGGILVDNSANLSVSPTDDSAKNDPIAGQGTRFTVKAGNADSFTWDFGDESSIEGSDKVTHAYAKGGSYTVSVIAKKANSYVSTATRTVKVLDPLPPRKLPMSGALGSYVSISFSSSYVRVGDPVTVTAGGWTGTGDLTNYLKAYLNNWGVKVNNVLESSATGFPDKSFTFTPTKPGMYSVVGCKDTSDCFAVDSIYVYPKDHKSQAPAASSEYAERLTWLHNQARDNVSPVAKVRLHNINWSQSLAEVAQQWANQCPGGHNSGRAAMIPGASGENIFFTPRYYSDLELAEKAMSAFVGENRYYHIADNSCDTNQICGHYKQVVAEQALEFGCSMPVACVKFNTDENSLDGVKNMTNAKVLVCNYRSGISSSLRPYATAD